MRLCEKKKRTARQAKDDNTAHEHTHTHTHIYLFIYEDEGQKGTQESSQKMQKDALKG